MLGRLRKELEGSDVLAKRYQFHPAQHRDGVEVKIAGRKLVDFSSWDVLGLRSKRQVKWAVQSEVENGGLGSYSPRLVAGTTLPHLHCEQRIAQFLGEEGALLFSSKNQAVLSLVTAICSEKDVVLFDETMRSPIADAAFLVNAGAVPYPHNNLDALHDRLRESHKATNRLIIQEYLSPVSGLVCDLAGLISLAETHDAYIVLDDSYALGMLGVRGAASSEERPREERILCRYGDLSLVLGCFGAFVGASKILIEYILSRSRTFLEESAPPAALAAGIEASLDLSELSLLARDRAGKLATLLREELERLCGVTLIDQKTPLLCIPSRSAGQARRVGEALQQQGWLVDVVEGVQPRSEKAILRVLTSTRHSEQQIQDLAMAFKNNVSVHVRN